MFTGFKAAGTTGGVNLDYLTKLASDGGAKVRFMGTRVLVVHMLYLGTVPFM